MSIDWKELGLEVLINLVKKNKIDPWDVDLVFLADKFLEEVNLIEKEYQLEAAAKVILFVSKIFRIKVESLNNSANDEDPAILKKEASFPQEFIQEVFLESSSEEENSLDFLESFSLPNNFEQIPESEQKESLLQSLLIELEKRAITNYQNPEKIITQRQNHLKPKRIKKVTVFDLVSLLEDSIPDLNEEDYTESIEDSFLETSADSINLREDESKSIFEIAHEENLEQKIKELSELVLNSLEINQSKPIEDLKTEKIKELAELFLVTIFLSHDGKVSLSQEYFYKDLEITRIV